MSALLPPLAVEEVILENGKFTEEASSSELCDNMKAHGVFQTSSETCAKKNSPLLGFGDTCTTSLGHLPARKQSRT